MIIVVKGIVKDDVVSNETVAVTDIYDPKGRMQYFQDKPCACMFKLIVSKKGNLVCLLQDIKEI